MHWHRNRRNRNLKDRRRREKVLQAVGQEDAGEAKEAHLDGQRLDAAVDAGRNERAETEAKRFLDNQVK